MTLCQTGEKPLYKALLSQGCTDPVYFVQQDGWFIFSSTQNLAHRLADLSTNKVKLTTNRPERVEVTLDISELWVFLYDKFLYLFPQSCAEALHLSAESVERLKQGSYKFSSSDSLENIRRKKIYEKQLEKLNGNIAEIEHKLVGIECSLRHIAEDGILGREVEKAIIAIARSHSKELDKKYKMFENAIKKEL